LNPHRATRHTDPPQKRRASGGQALNPAFLSALLAPWNFRQRAEAPPVIQQGAYSTGELSAFSLL